MEVEKRRERVRRRARSRPMLRRPLRKVMMSRTSNKKSNRKNLSNSSNSSRERHPKQPAPVGAISNRPDMLSLKTLILTRTYSSHSLLEMLGKFNLLPITR